MYNFNVNTVQKHIQKEHVCYTNLRFEMTCICKTTRKSALKMIADLPSIKEFP